MPRIGQLLVQADLVSENNLSRALGVQNFAGGRIGTLLLERGSVNEDDLGKTLGLQHGCEYISWRVLDEILPVTIAALPAKFAIKHGVIPYDRGESYLKIVLRDPSDLRILDELFFVTGRKIIAAVAPEVRIYQGLEKYYAEQRTPRFAILAEKLSRLTRLPRVSRQAPPPPPEFFKEAPKRTAALPAQQEIWGETGETDMTAPPIIQSWKIQGPVGGWAGTASPVSRREDLETISWEEIPPPPLWVPEKPSPTAAPVLPPESATRAPEAAPSTDSVQIRREAGVARPIATAPAPPAAVVASEQPSAAPVPSILAPAPTEATVPAPAKAAAPASASPVRTAPVEAPAVSQPSVPAAQTAPSPASIAAQAPAPRKVAEKRTALPSAADFPDVLAGADRDAIATAALAALSNRFLRAAIFTAKPRVVSGWAATGEGVDLPRFRRVEIPWNEPSVFLNVRLSRAFYLGPLPPLPRHEAIAQAMAGWPDECIVQPVLIREKPVAFFYAEFSREHGATPLDLAYLRELAAAASCAFAAAIRLKKKEI